MKIRYFSFSLLSLVFFLITTGCKSTSSETDLQNCQMETTSCPESTDSGKDRGYDPCLINKKLPVCKSSG